MRRNRGPWRNTLLDAGAKHPKSVFSVHLRAFSLLLRVKTLACGPSTDRNECYFNPSRERDHRAELLRGHHLHPNGVEDRPAKDYIPIENPPSTGIAVPVTKSDAELARNAATPAISSGVPHLA